MKTVIPLLILALCLYSMNSTAQAILKFDKLSHHFGKFPEKVLQTHKFVFTNNGNEPLVIQQVVSSCGCTASDYTKTPIKPGKQGEIIVSYNGKGMPAGYFKKSIIVRSNANNQMVRLHIEGVITK